MDPAKVDATHSRNSLVRRALLIMLPAAAWTTVLYFADAVLSAAAIWSFVIASAGGLGVSYKVSTENRMRFYPLVIGQLLFLSVFFVLLGWAVVSSPM